MPATTTPPCSARPTPRRWFAWARVTRPTSRPTGARCSPSSSPRPQQADALPHGRRAIAPARSRRIPVVQAEAFFPGAETPAHLRQRAGPRARGARADTRRRPACARDAGGDRRRPRLARPPGRRRAPGEWRLPDVLVAGGALHGGHRAEAKEQVVRWTEDGRALGVCNPNQIPTRVYRVDLVTGPTCRPSRRSRGGTSRAAVVIWLSLARDPRVYAYQTARIGLDAVHGAGSALSTSRHAEETASER